MANSITLRESGELSNPQIVELLGPTPSAYVYKRKGRGGVEFDYVSIGYVIKKLNRVFGFAGWDFEIVEQGEKAEQIWVLGKLIIKDGQGNTITKMQYGSSDVKKLRDGGNVDYADDLKSASSDALKKAASLLGIASDVYYPKEYKELRADFLSEEQKPELPVPDRGSVTVKTPAEAKKRLEEIIKSKEIKNV